MKNQLEQCADGIVLYKTLTGWKLVLVNRLGTPKGIALPGGRIDPGETEEECIVREIKEETGLDYKILNRLKKYDAPGRDPRGQKETIVFIGIATGQFHEGELDKTELVFMQADLPLVIRHKNDFAFDHYQIISENWDVISTLVNVLKHNSV